MGSENDQKRMIIEVGSDVVDRLNKKAEVSLEFIRSTLVLDIAQFDFSLNQGAGSISKT
jgi:hypothetical protein